MIKRITFIYLLSFVFLASCGSETGGGPGEPAKPTPPTPPTQGVVAQLVLFGAAWCTDCSADIPVIQQELKNKLGSRVESLALRMVVATDPRGKEPTAEDADQYAAKLGFEGVTEPEVHVKRKWKTFGEYFPGIREGLPAGVLLDKDGNVITAFPPVSNSFQPTTVVTAAVEEVNKWSAQ